MATRPDRLPYEGGVADLAATYRDAQRRIAALVRAAIAAEDLRTAQRRRLQLAAVLALLDQLGAQTDRDARDLVEQAFAQSAERVVGEIAALNIAAPEIPGAFASVSREAVIALQDSIVGRLDTARRTVGRTVDDVYAQAGRRAALRAVLGAEGSPQTAARQLATDLQRDPKVRRLIRNGGAGFIDKAGKRWALDTYSQMAVRTVTREAVVQGALARMASHGISLARVSLHGDACDICIPWQGKLVSLDGATSSYQGEAVTTLGALPNGGPPFHPNCRHSLSPVAVRIEAIRRELAGRA